MPGNRPNADAVALALKAASPPSSDHTIHKEYDRHVSPMFASMRYRNYRLWFAGALVANIGTWMQRVAQDWLVLTVLTDDSAVAVGVVTALQFLPMLALSPYAGLLADRLPRRKLLAATQASMGLLALGLGVLVLTGAAQLWHVYFFALGLGVVAALDAPVRQTFVAEMVPEESLPNAVGLNSASFNAARLIGPGAAGVLIAVVGPGWVFVINALTFAATLIALGAMRGADLRSLPHAPRGPGQILAGVRYVRARSDILIIMAVLGLVSAFGLNFQLTSAVMARGEFGKGAGEYGLLGSILAIGSLAGALLAARRPRPRVRLVLASALAFGISMAVMAIAPTYEVFALAAIPVGFFSLTMLTAANATIQVSTEPVMRGRVMSLYMMVLLGATPIGSPIIGWIAQAWGPRWSIGSGAIVTIGAALLASAFASRLWHVQVRYRLHSTPHLQISHPADRAAAREVARDALAVSDTGERANAA